MTLEDVMNAYHEQGAAWYAADISPLLWVAIFAAYFLFVWLLYRIAAAVCEATSEE